MKTRLQLNDKLSFEIEGTNQKEIFEQLAALQEIFGVAKCGKCGCTDLSFVVRENEGNKYYELHCDKCHARLAFGSHKTGDTLFPKKKEGDTYLPDNGWTKWDKEQQKRV